MTFLSRPPASGACEPPTPSYRARRAAARACSISDLRSIAQRRLPRGVFDFIDGGSEDERTLTANLKALSVVRLYPRTLVDVSTTDMSVNILGKPIAMPLIVGPTGAAGFVWPRGDLSIARAAQASGVPFTLSTSASVSIDDIATEIAGRRWFQCYVFKQRDFTRRLIGSAARAGYEALVITVDLPVGGKRERDFRNDFAIPFSYTARNVLDFARHPVWALSMLRNGAPKLENLRGFAPSNDTATVASSVGRNYDASFTWDDLAAIRDLWTGKLIVKGIVRPEEAIRAAALGCDALVVSNHGGRQLDGGAGTLSLLPTVASAVGTRLDVLLDGGVRRGSDIVKAVALGAKAVLIGRSTLYGAAVAGEVGAARAIAILREEFERTLQLLGVPRAADLTPDVLIPSDRLSLTRKGASTDAG
jgi:(S)-mandelate dehydrogenase